MPNIQPFLWFDSQAEEAAKFYTSIFKNSKINSVSHYGEGAPLPAGTIMTVAFELDGQKFIALNGGPKFKFNESVSFFISVKTQDEIDYFWDKLTEGGEPNVCGWLKDKYGLSWQVIPTILMEFPRDPDPAKAARVMQAMYRMKKIIIADLEAAYEGK
jgi:predicted 3-demethylubiquinone-9 3-methyltransferase (glyoxalase superfamily)